ncbi:MAG: endonuclease III [Candidatus Brocadiae bacterium]|nr:endonuclease III [Candidatus Brocadiia bacterium]
MKQTKNQIQKILETLHSLYPKVKTELLHESPFQLLIATMLSAQCTDKQVNAVTPLLFQKMPCAEHIANASIEEIEEKIHSTGFFRNKARNIKKCCQILVEKYHGNIPSSLEELVALPGVGRKTANVVLSSAFNVPAIVVDTHVIRISARLGLTKEKDPEKIELDLQKCIPKEYWSDLSLQLIFLGRSLCPARNPKCTICPLNSWCVFGKKQIKKLL